jgi:hypothetical protein
MVGAGKRSERRLDVVPPLLVVETPLHQLSDECAPPTRANPSIQLGHEFLIERYVQTHVLTIAHSS